MIALPGVGDTLLVGGVTTKLLAMKDTGAIIVLAHREHRLHPFATWQLDPVNGALYSGRYWDTRDRAEADYADRA